MMMRRKSVAGNGRETRPSHLTDAPALQPTREPQSREMDQGRGHGHLLLSLSLSPSLTAVSPSSACQQVRPHSAF